MDVHAVSFITPLRVALTWDTQHVGETTIRRGKLTCAIFLREVLDELRLGYRTPDFRQGTSELAHSSPRRKQPLLSSFALYE